MHSLRAAAGVGVLGGAIGVFVAVTPVGWQLEESVGLPWLFRLRGQIEAPADVAIVSIDPTSSDPPDRSPQTSDLPRQRYARLIDELVRREASVIAIDIEFLDQRSDGGDAVLASAIERSQRVALLQHAGSEPFGFTLLSPISELTDSARGLAPFPPLPRTRIYLEKTNSMPPSPVWVSAPAQISC